MKLVFDPDIDPWHRGLFRDAAKDLGLEITEIPAEADLGIAQITLERPSIPAWARKDSRPLLLLCAPKTVADIEKILQEPIEYILFRRYPYNLAEAVTMMKEFFEFANKKEQEA